MTTESLEVSEFLPEQQTDEHVAPEQDSPRRIVFSCALLLAIVALCDVVIYRGAGFAGYTLLFGLLPLMMAAQSLRRPGLRSAVLVILIGLLAADLLWCGSWISVAAGFLLLPALALTLTGRAPYVFDAVNTLAQLVPGGFLALTRYFPAMVRVRSTPRADRVVAVVVPVVAVAMFAIVFVLANPDLISWISETLTNGIRRLRKWLLNFGPSPLEVGFWFIVAWLGGGLLRLLRMTQPVQTAHQVADAPAETQAAPLYETHRNTLAGLVVLFAVYLAYEFTTLWGREFPPGFHYSGYAHEGAAWLTLALAMATAVLSFIFAGRTLSDPRLHRLKNWGNLWAIENLLLAVAVYHRLHIYIGFNGMTRMRIVGILGISAVVAGLLLVLWKIHRRYSFFWLVQRDLWVLALAMYAYCVLPVDWLTTRYNVHRILAGDPAPSVQISVHPLSAEGLLQLPPLLDSDDPLIREGVRSMLALELRRLDTRYAGEDSSHWTAYQLAERKLHDRLTRRSDDLAAYRNPAARKSARDAFDAYAYQWY